MLLNVVKAKQNVALKQGFDCEFNINNDLLLNCKITSPIKVVGFMCYQNEVLNVNATISLTVNAICDNCGEEFDRTYKFDFNENFVENFNSHNEEDYLINQTCVELDKAVVDALLLNMPTKMLCKPSCKGLCPICGKNKNLYSCGCKLLQDERKRQDNPFSALKNNN